MAGFGDLVAEPGARRRVPVDEVFGFRRQGRVLWGAVVVPAELGDGSDRRQGGRGGEFGQERENRGPGGVGVGEVGDDGGDGGGGKVAFAGGQLAGEGGGGPGHDGLDLVARGRGRRA